MTSATAARDEVRAGFMPLVDAAPLIVASVMGFAEAEGLHLTLVREMSWATLRDRLAVRHVDVAHLLAPLPIASNLGLGPLPTPLVAPMSLGFGGNTVTVSKALWNELAAHDAPIDFDAAGTARAFGEVVRDRARRGAPRVVIGVVHAYSAHLYEFAYWLATANVIAGQGVELVVVPPPFTSDALATGQIDGFCVGEPWGSVASQSGVGVILTTKAHIWRSSPDKVMAARAAWAEDNKALLFRLIRAVYLAAEWCDVPENRATLLSILARPEFLGRAEQDLMPSVSRRLMAPSGEPVAVEGFLNFAARAATFPWVSHALWFYSQMVRWQQVDFSPEGLQKARATYRPDLYRAALSQHGIPLPAANSKVEGSLAAETPVGSAVGRLALGPDGFFDGRIFDPADVEGYIGRFAIRGTTSGRTAVD